VPIVERKPLARLLHGSVDVGDPIPPDAYAAVAEVLAYVYRMNGRAA
jgi:flagellar biosynthetic protein FlhB